MHIDLMDQIDGVVWTQAHPTDPTNLNRYIVYTNGIWNANGHKSNFPENGLTTNEPYFSLF
jgi:hypothetical protein